MSASDWVNITCAGVALLATIIIAVMQIKQSNRMEKFEKRQDMRDEQRHQEKVRSLAVSFISKHYKERGLIPLCAIATMYNDLFYYHREIYREFCCYTREVQNKILEYCEIDLPIDDVNIYSKCLNALEKTYYSHFPQDKRIFYDGGKYIERSITGYAEKMIPNQDIEFVDYITDILSQAFRDDDKNATPIEKLSEKYDFGTLNEIDACQFATVIAKYIAIYGNKNSDGKLYGSPELSDEATMEDLFLLSLFEMYTNLVLDN